MRLLLRTSTSVAVLALFVASACGTSEPSQGTLPQLSYSRVQWNADSGRARIELRNASGIRLAVMGCPGFEMRAVNGSWASVPRSREEACVWPVYLVAPDSTLAFDFPVTSLAAGCSYRLRVQIAIPGQQGTEKVHDGDLKFEGTVSPELCL